MPSCVGFGVIDQYLKYRDQLDSEEEYTNMDPKARHFFATEENGQFLSGSRSLVQRSSGEPNNFLGMEDGSWYLEPVEDMSSTTTVTPVSLDSSLSSSLPFQHTNRTFVAEAAGSGCTVIQTFDQQLSGGDSPDLFDLDKPTSFYEESLADGKSVKVEQCEKLSAYCVSNSSQLPVVRDEVQSLMAVIREDIMEMSSYLNVSTDPREWNHQDTQTWVQYICRKNNFPEDCVNLFSVKGDVLCQMQLQDFQWRAPVCGSFLHESLDILKMARSFVTKDHPEQTDMLFPSLMFSDVASESSCSLPATVLSDSRRQGPSSSPAPSTDSTCSTLSSSSGGHNSSFTLSQDSQDEDVFTPSRKSGQHNSNRSTSNHIHLPHRGPRPGKQTIHLWQFLKELLEDSESYLSCIKWLDRSKGIFKIEDSTKVAKLWGRRKNRPAMNYDKLSRSVRQYYKKGIIKKTELSKRLVYQFCQPYL